MKSKIVRQVIEKYLSSGDFNGLSYTSLHQSLNIDENTLLILLSELIEEDQIEIVYGDYHPNPHIKAFSGLDKSEQFSKLKNHELLSYACLYPHSSVLKNISQISIEYADRPYSKELALGAGQLDYRAFDLSILEIYRNDPRYHYDNNDISGRISVTTEHYQSESMPNSDKALLQTFGFCYNAVFDRAVAVYLRYLSDLTPEHQQIWKSKELVGDYKLHPDYYLMSILGNWGTRISIFDAFIQEIDTINKMCETIRKPHLFRNAFLGSRPREFAFLLRPTLTEFNSFVHLLDKMMSDNLNIDFFRGDISLEIEKERPDGKIVIKPKGTIQLLEDWIRKYYRPSEPEILNEIFAAFRKVRSLRQKPAHAVKENEFNQQYFKDQRQLINKAYNAMRTIRLILANHPLVKSNPPEIERLLFEGKIWDL